MIWGDNLNEKISGNLIIIGGAEDKRGIGKGFSQQPSWGP